MLWRFLSARPRYAAVIGMALMLSVLVHLGTTSHDSAGATPPTAQLHVPTGSEAPAAQSVGIAAQTTRPAPQHPHLAEHPSHPPRKTPHPQPASPAPGTALFVPRPARGSAAPAAHAGAAAPVSHSILRC